MKNLKRVLSLALATVMLLGMMVVGANAAFNDQSSIHYTEAVNTLVGLGVINGMDNNTFQPNGTLTRAQAAKIVAYVKAGSNATTVGYYDGVTKFTDVKSNHSWAQGSINYCVSLNIISGMTDTTFAPDAQITGAQLAKMMLVALGIAPSSEDSTLSLTGANWQLNAIRMANEYGLFKGMNSNFSATRAITREEACQVMFNTLMQKGFEIVPVGQNGYLQINRKTTTLLEDCYNTNAPVVGVVTANDATSVANPGETTVDLNGTPTRYKVKTGLDMIGHAVKIYTEKNNATKVVAIVDQATHVATVTTGKSGAGISANAARDNGFTKAAISGTQTFSHNYAAASSATLADQTNTILISNSPADETTGLFPVDFIIQTDSTIYTVYTDAYKTVNKDGDITQVYAGGNTSTLTATTPGVENLSSDRTNPSVIVVTTIGTAKSVEVCTPVKGVVQQLTGSPTVTSFVASGTTYAPLKASAAVTVPTSADLGKEVTLYVTANGAVAHSTGVAAATTYAYVAQFGRKTLSSGNNLSDPTAALVADVYFADGTHTVYPVNVDATTGGAFKGDSFASATATTKGKNIGVYAYTINDKGEITLTDGTAATVTGITKGVSKLTASGTVYANDKSVLFYVNGTYGETSYSVEVKTGIANAVTTTAGVGITIQAVTSTNANSNVILDAAVITGQATTTGAPDVYYFADGEGDFVLSQTGAKAFTATYKVYDKTGAKVERVYTSETTITKASAGFVVENATGSNLAAASNAAPNTYVPSVTTAGYYNNSLTLTGGTLVQTGGATIVDLTGEGYEGLFVSGKTTTVAVAYTTTNGINNATLIVVISQAA